MTKSPQETPAGGPSDPTSAPVGTNLGNLCGRPQEGDKPRRGGALTAGGMESCPTSTSAAAPTEGEASGTAAAPRNPPLAATRSAGAPGGAPVGPPPPALTYLSLFAGIGGLDLGLDRAGLRCVGQVEIDAYCRRVLAKHWPEVPRHDDVRTAVGWWRRLGAVRPDVVAGGFPCQPVSQGGRKLAQADERWLWPEMRDVVAELRPRYVVVENVVGLLARGFDQVVGDLAALGYDSEWEVLTACTFGAPHMRHRVFLVAYPHRIGRGPWTRQSPHEPPREWRDRRNDRELREARWATSPRAVRMALRVPDRVDRIRAVGNSVSPPVAEFVGRLIVADAAEAVAA